MAISDNKIKLFSESTKNEFKGEQLIIPENEIDSFWSWFKDNAAIYSPETFENIEITDFKGICFDISQKIYRSKGLDYCEGFLQIGGEPIYHGFNLKDGKVVDYTAKKNLKAYAKDNNGELPSDYCGVIIPKEFVESENSDYLDDDSFNIPPLLYKYFKTKK